MNSSTTQEGAVVKREVDFVQSLLETLRDEGYKTRLEVPNAGQSIDVVATKGRWVTAIEVKKTDWKRAVWQCGAHEILADFICIAIASVRVSEDLVEMAQQRGYGILHFDRDRSHFIWHLRPTLNRQLWRPQRRIWSRDLKEILHEC